MTPTVRGAAAMTKTCSLLMALGGGAAAFAIVALVAHFSSGRVSIVSAMGVGVVWAVAFSFRSRRARMERLPARRR